MKQEITLSDQDFPNRYANLQKYDRYEFCTQKNQAIKIPFSAKKFENTRFKSGRYEKCTFNDCSFNAVGLSGTHFISCKLNDCIIDDSNMQFCEFSQDSKLLGVNKVAKICDSNLSQSMFCNCELKKVSFKSTTISQARFFNVSFQNIDWKSCTLQDNIFDNVCMQNISLVGCNLEYSIFNNAIFKEKATLPFHQIPYAFGLLEYLKSYHNEILVGSVSMGDKVITSQEYIDLLPELFSYYLEMNEYFPAINIALFNKDYVRVNSLIDTGIQCYIVSNDFRKIKGICRLIADNPFYDKHYMTQLYFKLVEYYNKISVNEYEKYQYSLHINDIKKILTGFDDTAPVAQLYLKTDITSADADKLGFFYQFIEQCLGDYGISNEEYFLEIRHNSNPLSFWIEISKDEVAAILYAIGMLMSVITENPEFLQTALDVIGNIATIGSFAVQIGSMIKNSKKTTNTNPLQIANKDMQYMKTKHQLLENKKISIDISLPFFNFSYQNEKQYKG